MSCLSTVLSVLLFTEFKEAVLKHSLWVGVLNGSNQCSRPNFGCIGYICIGPLDSLQHVLRHGSSMAGVGLQHM